MFKKVVVAVLAISLFCTFSTASVSATSHSKHECASHDSHAGPELDEAAVSRAKAKFAEKIRSLGGRVFDGKQELIDYLISSGHTNIRVTDTLEAEIYAVVPRDVVRALGVESSIDRGIQDDVVILAGEIRYCPGCLTIVVFVITAILSGYTYDAWKVFLDWIRSLICSICGTTAEQEQTTVMSECPDCGPAGSPRVVSSNNGRVTLYCPRLQTTWYEYNPY